MNLAEQLIDQYLGEAPAAKTPKFISKASRKAKTTLASLKKIISKINGANWGGQHVDLSGHAWDVSVKFKSPDDAKSFDSKYSHGKSKEPFWSRGISNRVFVDVRFED